MKIGILGASGFVGRNLLEGISKEFNAVGFSRNKSENTDFQLFDLDNKNTWNGILKSDFDIIINSAAYGVVKTQQDLQTMYNTNYFNTRDLYIYLKSQSKKMPYWIQIGTAFEYDLNEGEIIENTTCQPLTHYGISKLMCSNFFLNKVDKANFTILRPFGMFGKYEDHTKIFPALMNAQKNQSKIELSAGDQRRDYLYVNDLVNFHIHLLKKNDLINLPDIINIGTGKLRSLKEMAMDISKNVQHFNSDLWGWGNLPGRAGESDYFYNNSNLAFDLGLDVTDHETAFKAIIPYYI